MSDKFDPLMVKTGDEFSSSSVFRGLPDGVVLQASKVTSDGVKRSIFFKASLLGIPLGTMILDIRGSKQEWWGLQ